ncbi:branched-chain amino acid ABC transporter permease [Limnochorda pilosa]|uniref:ABC transporter permease n=1 Tax=Limnochorda pilosa TaxID=1555112 RepID=A0A0K2SK41_LIMPI|nr:branched-chain amino acid ABC transporter permease [Limnochorda pilosa]BAS27483.1 ABC transporter permease [Limnochorda pilosa]
MTLFVEQLANGLTVGAVYALVALGYTMVYGVMKLINFAHGELFMLGAYLGFTVLVSTALGGALPAGAALLVIILLAMGGVALLGLTVERVAYRPLQRANRLTAVVSALGVSIFLQNSAMLLWGPRYRAYPGWAVPDVRWSVAGVHVGLMQVLILAVALVLMLGLYYVIQRTFLGAAIRATAIDHDTARLMGINVDRIIQLIFVIGPALGAAAGVLLGLYYRQIHFTMGWSYGLKAFTAAIMGGIGNIPGAMVGGLLLGTLEMLGAGYLSAAWKDAFVFAILILLLIVRPTGLLGERVAEKV